MTEAMQNRARDQFTALVQPERITDAQVSAAVRQEIDYAVGLSTSAAYGGARDDGGAKTCIDRLRCFVDGWVHDTRPVARPLAQLKAEADPEFAEYLRLKEKFAIPKDDR